MSKCTFDLLEHFLCAGVSRREMGFGDGGSFGRAIHEAVSSILHIEVGEILGHETRIFATHNTNVIYSSCRIKPEEVLGPIKLFLILSYV
jgi:hypothetical protein